MTKNYCEAIKNATKYDCAAAFVDGECPTYKEMGDLFVQMLEYFSDNEHDDQAFELLTSMVLDYASEVM